MDDLSGLFTRSKAPGSWKKSCRCQDDYKDYLLEEIDKQSEQNQRLVEAVYAEEPGTASLGSLYYHEFLHGSSMETAKGSFVALPGPASIMGPKHDIGVDKIILRDFHSATTEFRDKPDMEHLAPKLALKASPETIKRISGLRECHSQSLENPSDGRQALENMAGSDLCDLCDLCDLSDPPQKSSTFDASPATFSIAIPSVPPTPRATRCSVPPGPSSTISSREVDPAKLRPFIGPLPPRKPPPTRPLPKVPFPSPVNRRVLKRQPMRSMADEAEDGKQNFSEPSQHAPNFPGKKVVQDAAEQHVDGKTGQSLRRKISKLFLHDEHARPIETTAHTGNRPLSLAASCDSEAVSFSDIFDHVYNTAARRQFNHACASPNPVPGKDDNRGRVSRQSARPSISLPSGDILSRLPSQNDKTVVASPPAGSAPAPLSSFLDSRACESPTIKHPAIRDDLLLQARLGLISTKSAASSAAIPGFSKLPPGHNSVLEARCRRPAQTDTNVVLDAANPCLSTAVDTAKARAVKEASPTKRHRVPPTDVDPWPSFDRIVDLTWYRYARDVGGETVCSISKPSDLFEKVRMLFVAQYVKGSPFTKYDGMKRFQYFGLPPKVRFKIMRHVLADTHTAKPILLNGRRQAYPAWPDDAFIALQSVLGPLQPMLWVCPGLRADLMVTLFLTRPFHVIFSPFVKEKSQPLPTRWLFRYLHLMQDVRLELDMTKLGFGYGWEATTMSTRIQDIGDLVYKFTERMLSRNPDVNPMGRLTVHCRRYFGYRQGPNTVEGRRNAYRYSLLGGEQDDPRALIRYQNGSLYNENKPLNYNCRAPSMPPSARNPCSGHRRHHADLQNRVPYINENQFSVANSLRKLAGRVDSLRMVGFSEEWTYSTHRAIWPEVEQLAVPDRNKNMHIDRCTPSRHSYTAPGHAAFFDYGINQGIHRYPPLPDSQPMVCVEFDSNHNVFIELGSGRIITMTDDGVDIIPRCWNPLTPRLPSAPGPEPLGRPFSRARSTSVPRSSRIPTPKGRRKASPTMEAIQTGSPTKAAMLLGLPEMSVIQNGLASGADSESELPWTPTNSRSIGNASFKSRVDRDGSMSERDHPNELPSPRSGTGSATRMHKPEKLVTKRSFLLLGGSRKRTG